MRAVAIDGPAGAGKSTTAKALARRLGWSYVDTGAMYRAVTLRAVREGVELDGEASCVDGTLARLTRESRIELRDAGADQRVFLDGEDVTDAIRTPELTRLVRHVARCGAARREMVRKQRTLAERGRVVMEGRDIGTVVLPDAAVKFYLDAAPGERARRRAGDLERAGAHVDLAALEKEIAARDRSDLERADGPLRRAPDAETVDTTRMAFEEVVDRLEARTRERLGGV